MANAPIKTYRSAGVSVPIFRNENTKKDGKTFISYSCTVQRAYVDEKTGEFKNTSSLQGADILVASDLLERVYHEQLVDQSTN